MISRLFTTQFQVIRNAWVKEQGIWGADEQEVATFKGHIQQASINETQNLADRFTITHSIWCSPSANVKRGDLIVSGSKEYTVREIQDNSFIGSNKHLELLVELTTEVTSS
jgi:hypothetical protein